MQRAREGIGAVLLGLFVGCVPMQMNASKPPAGQGQCVAGSVQVVSRRAQNLLQSFGLTVATTAEGEGMRLRCTTATKGHFSLVLTQANTPEAERTQVKLEWEDGHDEALDIRIKAGLGVLEGI